ncbi:hypothetical protein [Granulicella arctica]|nr:hypothetical protein [Granulicella arctica]
MDTKSIVAQIDLEILKLQQAKVALVGVSAPLKMKAGRPKKAS